MAYEQEVIDAAKGLYVRGYTVKEIRHTLSLNNERIVYNWIDRFDWKSLQVDLTPEESAAKRFNLLMEMDNKTDLHFKEIDSLTNVLVKFAQVKEQAKLTKKQSRSQSSGCSNCDDENESQTPRQARNERRKRKRKIKNDISKLTPDDFLKVREELFFQYQLDFMDQKHQRTRFVLKSRQIGFTFLCAFEAFEDAVLNGGNQVFLSASKKQAFIFKTYILLFAKQYFDIELKGGEEVILSNGAALQFISTNANTSQGYTGNLYVDEVFWQGDFQKLNAVAKPIAAHKQWRRTYISTPSVKEHGAYALWSGETFKENQRKRGKKAANDADFDISHKALKHGKLGADGIWRQIITIHDAEEAGCDLFDIEELRNEYTDLEWRNLFLCEFMDQSQSIFNMLDLIACGVDTSLLWRDFDRSAERPLGNHPVWVGYDPARFGDQSTVVVIAPPLKAGASFRVVEKLKVFGNYTNQAAQIKPLFDKYNVEYMGIDRTGPGQGVFEEIEKYFPKAEGIHYTYERKQKLVIKSQSVVERRQIEWDQEDDKELPLAFMQVKQVAKNDKIFYEADRTAKTGHADYAMAIMNALANEPLATKKRKSTVVFSQKAS